MQSSNAWVEVRVDGESMGRTKAAAVPYAVTAHPAVAAAPDGELAATLADLQIVPEAVEVGSGSRTAARSTARARRAAGRVAGDPVG